MSENSAFPVPNTPVCPWCHTYADINDRDDEVVMVGSATWHGDCLSESEDEAPSDADYDELDGHA